MSTNGIGRTLRIYQLNAEGTSRAKYNYPPRSAKDLEVDILLLQEMHISDDSSVSKLVAAVHHAKSGIATYLRHNLTDFSILNKLSTSDVFMTTVKVGTTIITNVYKPPRTKWPPPVLPGKMPTLKSLLAISTVITLHGVMSQMMSLVNN